MRWAMVVWPVAADTLVLQVDIGQLAVFLATLSQQLQCNVFAYDYSGYGLSSGKPREANLYADVDAAIACLMEK